MKIPIGILGATGTVGQRFIQLLENHPWFQVVCVAASPRSAGKLYSEAVKDRWVVESAIPGRIGNLKVFDVEAEQKEIAEQTAFTFSAISLDKAKVREIENSYAETGIPVISCNSAHRWTEDVPMIMPEINPQHVDLITIQKKNRSWEKGFIAVKPNCSIQSYVPVIEALKSFIPEKVIVSTYQAISGAGKTFETFPEISDNIIPFIKGEERKSEDEPMKIWGKIIDGKLEIAKKPKISSNCVRVPVSDGHLAAVNISFEIKPSREQFIEAIANFENPISGLELPSAPEPFLEYFEQEDRPQTALDRMLGNGMGIAVGRLRKDTVLDWKFIALSHNTLRGAAGGAILIAELLMKKGFIQE